MSTPPPPTLTSTPEKRKLSTDQLNILLCFVEQNRDLVFGRTGRTAQANAAQYENYCKWKDLAKEINALGDDNPRAGIEYKEYWKELKSKVYNKIYRARNRAKSTKQPVKVSLQDYEWRVYQVLNAHPMDRYLILEIGDNKTNSSLNSSTTKTENKAVLNMNKVEILKNLGLLSSNMHDLAKSQARLAQTQVALLRSLNELAEMIKNNSF